MPTPTPAHVGISASQLFIHELTALSKCVEADHSTGSDGESDAYESGCHAEPIDEDKVF
jgi:hypothetical protein